MTTEAKQVAALRTELAATIHRLTPHDEDLATQVPGLWLYRRTAPTAGACQVYAPALALIAQGAKRVTVGRATYAYGEATWLLTPLNLPAVSHVVKASAAKPYLACALMLDLAAAREMMADEEMLAQSAQSLGPAVATGPVTVDLLNVMLRLVNLLDTPRDVPVMAKLLHREVLYRLLTSEPGTMLRQIVTAGTQSHRISRAVDWLRTNFRKPLRLEELATHARMGESTLHHHFRALTGLSPLQFQKQLRLFEARRLMLAEGLDAGSAAFATGYESPTQFSREYRRQFGQPPMRDVTLLRDLDPGALSLMA